MNLKTILMFNSSTTALTSNGFRLFYDDQAIQWIITEGIRKPKPIMETDDFDKAFERWLEVSKQIVPPF